jgi:uncharacterized protein (DUF433 family)
MSTPYTRLWRCAGVRGGAPCLRTTRVPVDIVAERFAAGESIENIATDYGVPAANVAEAIRFVVDIKRPSLDSKAARARVAKLLPETRRRR